MTNPDDDERAGRKERRRAFKRVLEVPCAKHDAPVGRPCEQTPDGVCFERGQVAARRMTEAAKAHTEALWRGYRDGRWWA